MRRFGLVVIVLLLGGVLLPAAVDARFVRETVDASSMRCSGIFVVVCVRLTLEATGDCDDETAQCAVTIRLDGTHTGLPLLPLTGRSAILSVDGVDVGVSDSCEGGRSGLVCLTEAGPHAIGEIAYGNETVVRSEGWTSSGGVFVYTRGCHKVAATADGMTITTC